MSDNHHVLATLEALHEAVSRLAGVVEDVTAASYSDSAKVEDALHRASEHISRLRTEVSEPKE